MKQNAYICIPKTLFTDPKYKKISSEAKLLYGLLLDRVKLSKVNSWKDKEGRAFAYFTIDEMRSIFCCSNEKAVKTFAELDDKKGVGLIHRVNQGHGKPARIYIVELEEDNVENISYDEEKPETVGQEISKQAPRHIKTSGEDFNENRSLKLCPAEGNNNNKNNTDISYTDLSIHLPYKSKVVNSGSENGFQNSS